jgi:tetratricopeptide (TPR) repeat protein
MTTPPSASRWVRIATDPHADPLHKLLAGALLLHGSAVDEAIRLFEQVTQMEPPAALHAAALCGLGFARLCEGDVERAEAHLHQAIALDPWSWEPHYRLAELQAFEGDELAAAVSLLTALVLDGSGAAADQVRLNPLLADLRSLPEVQALWPRQGRTGHDGRAALFPVTAWGLEYAAFLGQDGGQEVPRTTISGLAS